MKQEEQKIMRSPLHQVHLQEGAKMVVFAGYYMPLRYTSEIIEHNTVRKNAGIFDLSHMGEIEIKGPKAMAMLQRITSNDLSRLTPGKAQYTCLLNQEGGIIDDIIIYNLKANTYLLVVNASNISKDLISLQQYDQEDVIIKNLSNDIALLAIQGPKAKEILQAITDANLDNLKYYTFTYSNIGSIKDILISATGYTGEKGYELYCKADEAEELWNLLMREGKKHSLLPIGLGARDSLRLEMGYCLYGNDIDETTNPLEANLGWITKFNKDFIAKEKLLQIKEQGISRKLVSFVAEKPGIPRKGLVITNKEENTIGRVSSGCYSPTLQQGIGMGYIDTKDLEDKDNIYIRSRNRLNKITLARFPCF